MKEHDKLMNWMSDTSSWKVDAVLEFLSDHGMLNEKGREMYETFDPPDYDEDEYKKSKSEIEAKVKRAVDRACERLRNADLEKKSREGGEADNEV